MKIIITQVKKIKKRNKRRRKKSKNSYYNFIYKEDIIGPIEIPKINYDKANNNNIVSFYEDIS